MKGSNADIILKTVLDHCATLKQKEFEQLNNSFNILIENISPQKTKVLSTKFLKDVLTEEDPRLLTIKGHLYLELFINEILQKETIDFKQLEKAGILNTFYKKVKYLEIQQILEADESSHILTINSIRNKFAHRVYYTIDKFSPQDFTYIKRNYPNHFQSKLEKNRTKINLTILKTMFMWVGFRLPDRFRYLYLIDTD